MYYVPWQKYFKNIFVDVNFSKNKFKSNSMLAQNKEK